ncbi:MAG: major facilitator family protein [Hyphomonas sp. BRH_c22]|uniref:MFS transporter n=1 Tax=Hyphomonas sp. BRH_c22 TaxID=1629710 RepID=UPI0005F1BC04|nr:MFS transporter [Hyphomonas sp. BRH_c22]KJS37514.1 MAG: major facilitator family protein [Hyphomonas sp. BRH_c22]
MSDKIEEIVDDIVEDAVGDVTSPVSGVSEALGAGASLLSTATHWRARRLRRGVGIELPAYLMVQCSWFMAFGLQMVLFPYLITGRDHLHLGGLELGLANMALSAPSVIFLLIGGVVAERADGRRLLIVLHLLAAVPAFILAVSVSRGELSYPVMIAYGLTIGTVGAFMMPARDSIVNEIVERRMRVGSSVTLQLGVTLATMAQFLAQIAGLILAGYADKMTRMPQWMGGFGIGPIAADKLLLAQGVVLAFGAVFALNLAKGRQVRTGRSGFGAAFGDIAEGFRAVRADGRLWAMTALMFGVGIFVIGAFLVVLPIVNRDVYGFGSDGIRDMFVTFWLGAFVSSVVLSIFRRIKRQGRLLLIAQFLGSSSILAMMWSIPHWAFLAIVFIWGLAAGISIAMSRSIVQDAAPKKKLARVLSIYQLGFMAGAPFGAALMGALVDIFGPQKIAIVPAGGMTLIILWMVFFTPVWNMKGQAWKEHAARK